MFKRVLLIWCLGLITTATFAANTDAGSNPLQTLRPSHPRLLVLDDQLATVKAMIKTNASSQTLYTQLLASAESLLHEAPRTYEIGGVEHTLLDVSRTMEGRIWLLAGIYRLNGDTRFAARARDEMLAATAFPDWYPKHFLDTAEMTAALGLGYDWLYDYLSPADRQTIRQAIISKGLEPGIAGLSEHGHLRGLHNNWAQVCNGGLTVGALAIADEEKARAAQLIQLTRVPMENIMKLFAPDGGFEEGPTYWNYATAYNACYLSALETALGTDFGLSQAKGFDLTGNYRMQTIGPIGKYANFGDASEDISSAPQMLWLAAKFNHPEYAEHEHTIREMLFVNPKHVRSDRFAVMELLWDKPGTGNLENAHLPAGATFERVAAAFIRSGWGNPNAIYIAFKGGNNHASHGHLDLGSFVLDAFGERWAVDLGADSYGLPGYFGAQRWSYYRMRTEGHNTLTIDNQNESLKGEARLTAFTTSANRSAAIASLNSAYPNALANWQRGTELLNQRQVLVQDELQPTKAVDITWNWHTKAGISIAASGTEAILSQGSAKLRLQILSPLPAKFTDESVTIPEPQRPAPGLHNLMIHLPATSAKTTIAVLIEGVDENSPAPAIVPLAQWR